MALQVRGERNAQFARGRDKRQLCWRERIDWLTVNRDWAALAGQWSAGWIRFRALEEGQKVVKCPAFIPRGGPPIEVGGGAAQPDAAIDRRRATDDTRAGEGKRRAASFTRIDMAPGIGFRIDRAGIEEIGWPFGKIGAVVGPGFQQQDRPSGVFTQSIGKDAAQAAPAPMIIASNVLSRLIHEPHLD